MRASAPEAEGPPGRDPEAPAPSGSSPLSTEVQRARSVLLESGARYRQLFEANGSGVFFGTLGGHILEANAALATTFGFGSGEEMTGVPFEELYWDAADRAALLHEARERGTLQNSELRIRRLDGSMAWVLVSAGLFHDDDGVTFVQGTMQDISERKLSEARVAVAAEERRDLLGRLFAAQEEERSRLAGELHDDALQLMAAAAFHIHAAETRTADSEIAAPLQSAIVLLEGVQQRLRSVVFGLRPVVLEQHGLGPGLRVSMSELLETDVACELYDDLPEEPDPQTAMALFRIGQEALANVRKHAKASRVEVHVRSADGGISIRIEDDGEGFSREQVNRLQVGHLGLRSMRERAETAGGWMRMESEPGEGTVVEAWVPLVTSST